MGITGDRLKAEYEGHTIELVRDNWAKTLSLWIDGVEVARESRALPRDITLGASFEHEGVRRAVVLRSIVRFPTTRDTLEIDGQPLELTRAK